MSDVPDDLVRTKLSPPRSGRGRVPRPRLFAILEGRAHDPLLLVSAPAGYGKSTLVSEWLASQPWPAAWLSLGAEDNDLCTFLRYLVAAIRAVFPDACTSMLTRLQALGLPSASALSAALANELDTLETPFYLVLDDYDCVDDPSIHDVLSGLLRHPPRPLHLILITRHDPPLPLATLRARGHLAEVRLAELRFDRSESARLLRELADVSLDETGMGVLERQNEGWAVGLRMICLALRGQKAPEAFLSNLRGGSPSMREYLLEEVLLTQPESLRDWLIRTSILDRFCAPLCEALCQKDGENASSDLDGRSFLANLEQRGLFGIALDPQLEWYRYHHVFQCLLREELGRRVGAREIAALHSRASRWFAEHDLVEEAMNHALVAGETAFSAELVAERRHDLINREDWHRLKSWLERLPAGSVGADPRLRVAKAWLSGYSYHWPEASALVADARSMNSRAPRGKESEILFAEMDALDSVACYERRDVAGALLSSKRAVEALPEELYFARGFASVVLSWAYQASGQPSAALEFLSRASERGRSLGPAYHTRIGLGRALVRFREGDLSDVLVTATRLLDLGKTHSLPESIQFARSLLGWAHYLRNELREAEPHLRSILDDAGFALKSWVGQATFALALCQAARGRFEDAIQETESLIRNAMEREVPSWIEEARVFEAEMALREGRDDDVRARARTPSFCQPLQPHFLYTPHLTLAKVHLARGTNESRQAAAVVLAWLRGEFEQSHDKLHLAEALAVEALLHEGEGRDSLALETLEASLALTEPGAAIRPYLDLGPPMSSLLKKLPARAAGTEHVRRILAGFDVESARESSPAITTAGAREALVEALTNREQDVLELLGQRLRDKEIAERLVISPGTVKSHLKNLYQKLGVSERREAVARAREIGILSSP